MKNLNLYLTTLLCLLITEAFGQVTFEDRAKAIAAKIEAITKDEKDALKIEVEAVNTQLSNGSITKEQADEKKRNLAESRAKSIEFRTNEAEKELHDLVQEKVDGKITAKDSTHMFAVTFDHKKNDKNKSESRATSQLVFAFGAHNLATDGAVAHSNFRYWGSHYFELGVTENTRLSATSNLMHLKVGFSVVYNTLRPTDNRIFSDIGRETILTPSEIHQEDTHLRNVYLVMPLHLEFDFSGSHSDADHIVFQTLQTFRFGLGGYAGVRLNTKQILEFNDADGHDVKQKTRAVYNVNDFIYGVSAYIGYKEASIYAKYNLSSLFRNNPVDQNGVSLGIRWDLK